LKNNTILDIMLYMTKRDFFNKLNAKEG